jgi:mannose-1-phosphate guanylyltransferase
MLYAIIMAGGAGKRLWPKSRSRFPKFFLRVKGKKTLLQGAVDRAKRVMPLDNILIVTSIKHVKAMRMALPRFPKKNIIAEPLSKNTAPAICLGAALIQKRDPNAVIYIMPADQLIEDNNVITEVFKLSTLISRIKDSIITIGIAPNFASTGYGYIKTAKLYRSLKTSSRYDVFKVGRFTEKPGMKKAKAFIRTKKYLWNSGIFISHAATLLSEFKLHTPAVWKVAMKIASTKDGAGFKNRLKRYYKNFPNISIDYAIMEKTDKAFVIKADPGWSDIGSWDVFKKYIPADKNQNAIDSEYIGIDTKNSVIIGGKGHLIATAGISDLVVVHTKDVTLICSKKNCEDVKKLVELAQAKHLDRYL